MKKIIFLLCLKLFAVSELHAQCESCNEVLPLSNGDFSTFLGTTAPYIRSCLNPAPPPYPTTTPNGFYFSNSNLPNWIRVNGLPNAHSGELDLKTSEGNGAGGHFCETVGSQGAAAYYPFLKNGKYEVTVNFSGWYNECSAPGNVSFGVFATTGLTEPDPASQNFVRTGTYTLPPATSLIGVWEPATWDSPEDGVLTPRSFCSEVFTHNYDQLFINVNQQSSEIYSSSYPGEEGQIRGFYGKLSSVKVKMCNECPRQTYWVNSAASPDPVTGTPFSSDGLFIDAFIDIDGLPFANNPTERTMLIAHAITVNHSASPGNAFTATANPNQFFEMVPNIACPSYNPYDCGFEGPSCMTPFTAADLHPHAPGGTWSSSDPSKVYVDPTGVAHSCPIGPCLTGYSAVNISYTVGKCIYTQNVFIEADCDGGAKHAPIVDSQFTNTDKIEEWKIYPNPTESSITISYSRPSFGQLKISLTDVSSRTRYTETVTCNQASSVQHSIDISALEPGVYFIDLTLNNQHVKKKIVKM